MKTFTRPRRCKKKKKSCRDGTAPHQFLPYVPEWVMRFKAQNIFERCENCGILRDVNGEQRPYPV